MNATIGHQRPKARTPHSLPDLALVSERRAAVLARSGKPSIVNACASRHDVHR
jgi:hypothetical protein